MRSDALGLFWEDTPKVKTAKLAPPKRTPPHRTWEAPGYLPGLAEALRFDVPLYTDNDLIEDALQARLTGKSHKFRYDIESYPNYFLIAFQSKANGKFLYFEYIEGVTQALDVKKLFWVLQSFCQVGFNSIGYDAVIAALAVAGVDSRGMWAATEMIIVEQMRAQDVLKRFRTKKLQFDHIDLIEVAPLRASLKIYSGRLHSQRMQDLPFVPGTVLSMDQIAIVRWYCLNDLAATGLLDDELDEEQSLRVAMSKEYDLDLRSKSDAQIAEAVIGHELELLNGMRSFRPDIPVGTGYRFNVPHFLQFRTPLMNWVCQTVANTWFVIDETGSIGLPPQLKDLDIKMGGSVYRMGIGGLHSTEKSAVHVSDQQYVLKDVDVESFYPRIILNQQLFPKHLGKNFLRVYDMLVTRRLAAKHAKDTVVANSLKIVINGSYGKLGSKWSILYAPDLLIQTTLTGQLVLLMLIERIELAGIAVVSANTDGIVIKCPREREEELNGIIKQWEVETNFKTEETRYGALYSRDVNNYVAVYEKPKKEKDGTFTYAKTKGAFSKPGLSKNPTNQICSEAVVKLLSERTPVSDTIYGCKDIRKFVSVRSVTGGAVKVLGTNYNPDQSEHNKKKIVTENGWYATSGGNWGRTQPDESLFECTLEEAYQRSCEVTTTQYLGKSIRWYYANDQEGEIIYAKNGNKVPRTEGACPCMDLPDELPTNIDYDWYMRETEKILVEIGYASRV